MSTTKVSVNGILTPQEVGEFIGSLYEHAAVGIEQVAPDGRLLMVNDALCRMLGYSRSELLSKTFDEITPPDDRAQETRLLKKMLAGEHKCYESEKRYLHRSGSVVWASVTSSVVRDGAGLALHCICVVRDITKQKLASSQFRLAIDSAPTAMVMVGEDGNIILVNSHTEKLFGYRSEELLRQPVEILVPKSFRKSHPALRRDFLLHPEERPMGHGRDLHARRKDGTQFSVEIGLHPIEVENGRWVLASIMDISERKRAEQALKKSEEKFSKAFRRSPMSLTLTSANDHRYIDVNETYERITGWRREEIIGRTPLDIGLYVDPTDRLALVNRALTEGGFRNQEVRFRMRDGSIRVALMSGELIELDGEPCLLNVGDDITEYKQVEEALKKSEEKFSKALRESPMALTLTSARDHRYIEVNETFVLLTGYSREETLGRTPFDLGLWVGPSMRWELLRKLMAEGSIRDQEVVIRTKGGRIRVGLGSAELIEIDGEQLVLSAVADITDRKRAEQAMQESEEKFRRVFQDAATGMVMLSPEGRFLAVNRAFCESLGCSEQELIGRDVLSVTHPEDQAISSRAMDQALTDKSGSQRFEKRYFHKNGQVLWGEVSPTLIRDSEGKPEYLVSQVVNITERKRAEQQLRDREAELKEAQRLAQVGNYLWDFRSNTIAWSEELYRIHGRDSILPPPSYKELSQFFAPESLDRLRAAIEKARLTGVVDDLDLELRRPDGSKRWIAAIGEAVRDADDRVVQLRGTVQDITERKQAEDALRESEERFRLIANAAPVMIWKSGTDKFCTYFNQPWLEFTGRPLEAELGNGWAEGVHPGDLPKCLEIYTQSFDSRVPFRMEYRLRRYDGQYRWIEDTGVPIVGPDGSFAGYIGSCADVTDRKRGEEALHTVSGKLIEAQEKERRRIARELHDDINQRLAMLAIDLQQLNDIPRLSVVQLRERAGELFKRTTEISSDIQLLSHRLHSSSLEYLGLVPAAEGFCREFAKHQKVKIDFVQSNVPSHLPSEVALGLFRVLQEALRNAVKHSGVRKFEVGLLGVSGGIQLKVRDSGKGFDPEAAESGQGLGLVSMRERVSLLKGTISILSKPEFGTEITVRIPLVVGMGASQAASA